MLIMPTKVPIRTAAGRYLLGGPRAHRLGRWAAGGLMGAPHGSPDSAPMEPMNCVMQRTAEGLTVWNGEQFHTIDQGVLAALFGIAPEQVTIHTLYAGGGFGRRANPHSDYLLETAQIVKATGADYPVKLVWSREDDMRGDGNCDEVCMTNATNSGNGKFCNFDAPIGSDGIPTKDSDCGRICGQQGCLTYKIGDGVCDPGEDFGSCPSDCEPPPPVCGDGTCNGAESQATCPVDCGFADPAACLLQTCSGQISNCSADFNCAGALQCLLGCNGDAACAASCGATLPEPAATLYSGVLTCDGQCLQ